MAERRKAVDSAKPAARRPRRHSPGSEAADERWATAWASGLRTSEGQEPSGTCSIVRWAS
jgi:hypothetical protein